LTSNEAADASDPTPPIAVARRRRLVARMLRQINDIGLSSLCAVSLRRFEVRF
jgi:hypothetical protein